MCRPVFFFAQIIPFHVFAQPLEISTHRLQFGGVTDILPDSLPLVLKNASTSSLTVTEVRFYNIYGKPAFSTQNVPFAIAPADSQTIFVKFSPLHNIYHNTEMVLFTDAPKGP